MNNSPAYYIYPAVKALRATPPPSPEEALRLRRLIAANVGDISSLRIILNLDPEEFAGFYPDMAQPELSTTDTIDSFLSHFGNPKASLPEEIDRISKTRPETATIHPSETAEEPPKTEAEMRRAVKNHEYQKALEIIEHLNLVNPEKSIYFADQMRFLKKLILIQNSANN